MLERQSVFVQKVLNHSLLTMVVFEKFYFTHRLTTFIYLFEGPFNFSSIPRDDFPAASVTKALYLLESCKYDSHPLMSVLGKIQHHSDVLNIEYNFNILYKA